MNEAIKTRREILKSIEKFAKENADAMFHLTLKVLYEHLNEDIDNCPSLPELERILDDLSKAENDFRKDKQAYFWKEYR